MQQSKEDVIRLLGLIPHADHGFFRETYRSGATPMTSRGQTDLSGDVYPAESIQGPLGDFWKGKGKGAGSVGVPRNIMTSILFMVTSGAAHDFRPNCPTRAHCVTTMKLREFLSHLVCCTVTESAW